MLGPVRFKLIDQVASEAVGALALAERVEHLRELDEQVDDLCSRTLLSPPGRQSYAGANEAKIERLIVAREKRIALLQARFEAGPSETDAVPA